MPLPNTRAIPRRWQTHNARTVNQIGMEALVRLSHPAGLGTRDPVTGKTPQVPAVAYWEGPARIQVHGQLLAADRERGAEQLVADYLVPVPLDVPGILFADLVDVLESPDPAQVGLRLYVVDVPTATQILQRNLGCSLTAPDRRGA